MQTIASVYVLNAWPGHQHCVVIVCSSHKAMILWDAKKKRGIVTFPSRYHHHIIVCNPNTRFNIPVENTSMLTKRLYCRLKIVQQSATRHAV